ncbi:peptidoglycan-binding protein [Leifsonia sp. NPDC058248]|uniref:peptidoglycan-binding protein n=1 Tax=Leifsonia sp. NPDC058248 TaxID=3346402 RepID=UPI0036DE42FA
MKLTAVAAWEKSFTAANQASGTVTSIDIEPGKELREGDLLFTVDLRPVRIAVGATPAFRPLSVDAKGPDVHQMLQLMSALGFYKGEPDDSFGAQARRAIEAYQRDQKLAVDGTVQTGDIIYVPSLPARVVLDAEMISVGSAVSGGERAVATLEAQPAFSIPIAEGQASTIGVGTAVQIETEVGSWNATVMDQVPSSDPSSRDLAAVLAPTDQGPICGDHCGSIPATGSTQFSASAILQSPVEGVVLPSVAIRSSSAGETFVIDSTGRRLTIDIVASAKGMCVVTGIDAGTKVRLSPTPSSAR